MPYLVVANNYCTAEPYRILLAVSAIGAPRHRLCCQGPSMREASHVVCRRTGVRISHVISVFSYTKIVWLISHKPCMVLIHHLLLSPLFVNVMVSQHILQKHRARKNKTSSESSNLDLGFIKKYIIAWNKEGRGW